MIKCENLTFEYEGDEDREKTVVLNGVDVSIEKGEFVCIVGHNGSGKSTLAKHFNAIKLPCGGKVLVDGLDTSDENLLYEIRSRVGLVFQNPDNQIVANIVEEDVAFAPENLGVKPDEIRKRVDEALRAVGMYENKMSAPHLLSGGQKQRIAIAGILAMQPEYIVLDEPTAMLDPTGRKEVLKTISKLNKELNMTVVLITHYMSETVRADRILVMKDGDIILEGTPREVFSKPEVLSSAGLDVPQSAELMYELKKEGINVPSGVIEIEECVEEILKLL